MPLIGISCQGPDGRRILSVQRLTSMAGSLDPLGIGPKLEAANEERIDNGFIYAIEANKSIEVVVKEPSHGQNAQVESCSSQTQVLGQMTGLQQDEPVATL